MSHWFSTQRSMPLKVSALLHNALGALSGRLLGRPGFPGHPPLVMWISQFLPIDRTAYHQRTADRHRQAAVAGDPRALRKMAYLYEHGLVIQESDHQALAGYHHAAARENRYAQFILGYFYEHGIGVIADAAEAIRWYKRSEQQRFALAAWRLGLCYQAGRGTSPNLHEAAWHFARAARYFHAPALIELGRLHEQEQLLPGSRHRARKSYRVAGLLGHPEGHYHLGRCLEAGIGGDKNISKALHYYRKAAHQDHPDALFRLGMLHLESSTLTHDPGIAVQWLRRAAQRGKAEAQYELAQYYLAGAGVPHDLSLAFKWLVAASMQGYAPATVQLRSINRSRVLEDLQQLARQRVEETQRQAEQGDTNAQRQLAEWYAQGTAELPQDWEKAAYWYEQLAIQAAADMQYHLAHIYLDRHTGLLNYQRAVYWLKHAADQGHADAWCELGISYYEGRGTGRDFQQAMTCFRRAAHMGSATAHYRVGLMYQNGEGVRPNQEAAYDWMQKAAELGHPDADAFMMEKYKQGDGGTYAEYLVHRELLAIVRESPATYRYFDEVVFLEKDGVNSSETDHILVCPAGIFVIETKNWAGRIYGTADDLDWVAKKKDGTTRNHKNPIRQNRVHVDTLKRKLGQDLPIDSLIVFYNPDFANELPANVISLDMLQGYFTGQPGRLTPQQVSEIANRIDTLRATQPDAKQEHIRRVETRQQKREQEQEDKWREIDAGKLS